MISYQDVRLMVNLLRHKFFGHRFPAHVAICVTNKCNLDCTYCYSQKFGMFQHDLTTEQMISLIDELFAMGTRYIVLTGGEPLIRKDIRQIIRHIVGKGMKCGMSSNALLFERNLDVLDYLTSVNISIDGDEETHIKNRGQQDYKKILRGVDTAIARGLPVSIGCVLTKANQHCIKYVADLAKDKGCQCYFHIPYWRVDSSEGERGYTACTPMSMEETSKAMAQIHDLKNSGYPISYSNRMHAYLRDWPFKTPTVHRKELRDGMSKGFKPIHCLAGECYCIIDADGSVFPCASMIGQVKALKLTEVGFRKAWDNILAVRCSACHFFLQNELNLLFSLDVPTWMNLVKSWPHLLKQKKLPPANQPPAPPAPLAPAEPQAVAKVG